MDVRARALLGRLYVVAVCATGAAVLIASIRALATPPLRFEWVALAILTWLSGYFSIKVPAVEATISLSEAFLFAQVLLFGSPSAVVTVALDGAWWSLRRKNWPLRRTLFNIAEPAVTIWAASQVATGVGRMPSILETTPTLGTLLFPAALFVATYFVMNAGLIGIAVASERGGSTLGIWRGQLMSLLFLSHCACMSIAVLLALNMPSLDLRSIGIVLPLVIISNLALKTWAARLEDTHEHLTQLNRLHMATVETLAMAIDAKDQVTHGHLRRVQTYAMELAAALGIVDDLELKGLGAAALLHDMGKLAVPDYILNKPGRLTAGEYDEIKLHAEVGAEILSSVDFPYPVVPIVRHHHESWDGTGYPDGLAGEAIPIGARILAVVDCYDALTSDRPYRPALSDAEAMEIIESRHGTMYDPRVVEAFRRIQPRLSTIAPPPAPSAGALARIRSRHAAQPGLDATASPPAQDNRPTAA